MDDSRQHQTRQLLLTPTFIGLYSTLFPLRLTHSRLAPFLPRTPNFSFFSMNLLVLYSKFPTGIVTTPRPTVSPPSIFQFEISCSGILVPPRPCRSRGRSELGLQGF